MVTAPPSGRSATDLVAAGRDHVNHGSPAQAVACYREALDQLAAAPTDATTDRLRARAHLGLALAEADHSGDADVGMAQLAAAEAVLPPDADDLRAALLGQRGILLIRTGRLEAALATFVSAEGVLGRTTPSHRASMVLNRGLLHLELGHGDEARADFERAIMEAGVADQPRTAYKARHNLACVAFLEGDLPRAIDGMASAPDHRDGTREDPDPITLMDRGRVLLEAGLVEDADRLLAQAQAGFEHQQRGRDLGEAALVRADAALVGGQLEQAARLAAAAVADFTLGHNHRWRRRAELVALAIEDRRLAEVADDESTDHRRALTELRHRARALAVEADDDEEVGTTARLIGIEAALAVGDRVTARAEFEAIALPVPSSLRLRLRWHLAGAALAAPDDVQRVVDDGVADLAAAQSQVGSRDLRTAMALHGRGLVERGIAAALRGADVDAIHRAVDLAHAASTRLTPVRADLADDERRLLAELRAVENRQWREPDAPEHVRTEVDGRAADLRQRLRQRSWQRQGQSSPPAPVAVAADWRRALDDVDAVGASFFAVGPDLHVLRTTATGSEVVRLGPSRPVMELVQRLRADLRVLVLPGLAAPMQAAVRASLAEALARVDAAIGVPLDVGGDDLVVVPHGALSLVPWSLLPSRRGAATTAASSATGWVGARQRGAVVADESVEVRALAGPDLDRAAEEVASVAASWGGRGAGLEATTNDLRSALAEADVVHLAAHGTHRRESPLFSSVRLADGALFAHELVADVRARLVVLSACDVGEQVVRPGDEPLGLAAALLEMGVATVVGAVAPIRDEVAARVGRGLHEHLVAGVPVAAAVSDVVAAASADGDVAPLVVLGDGMAPVIGAGRGTRDR